VWPECSPRRIARRTSRGPFMATGLYGGYRKEILALSYLFVQLGEMERKPFIVN